MPSPEITHDDERGVLFVGGREVDGRVDGRPCGACGGPRIYHSDFDALFCARCNSWLDSACGDPECGYCRNRPARPLAGAPRST